jgi:hypothetical protein
MILLGGAKCRHPPAVLDLRIPADVIDVQVGAENEVDLLGLHAGCLQIVEVAGVQHVVSRHFRPRLMVAAAGIDQDHVAIGAL